MNKLHLVCALLFVQCHLFAQWKPAAESELFKEAETGWTRLLFLKNGYTAYLVLGQDDNEIRLFDGKQQALVQKKIKPAFGTPGKDLYVNGIFESNGDIVCILTTKKSRKAYNIYRVVISGKTGDIRKEDKIAELVKKEWEHFDYRGNYPENYVSPICLVEKDPDSDQYAMLLYRRDEEPAKREEVITFNAEHQETSRTFIMSKNWSKGLGILELAYRKGELYVMVDGELNGKKVLAMGKVEKNTPEISLHHFEMPGSFVPYKSVFEYNKAVDKFVFLSYVQFELSSSSWRYEIWTGVFDPVKGELVRKEQVKLADAETEAKALFGKKAEYHGKPVNLVIHADGSWMVMIEELRTMSRQSMAMDNLTITDVAVDHLFMVYYDSNGQLARKNFLPKSHWTRYISVGPYYQKHYRNKAWRLDVGDQYKYSTYLELKGKGYVFYNDEIRRVQKQKEGKLAGHAIVSIRDLHGFPLSGDMIPDGQPVFGDPGGIKHYIAIPGSIVTDVERNKMAMLRITTGRKNMMQVVWLDI